MVRPSRVLHKVYFSLVTIVVIVTIVMSFGTTSRPLVRLVETKSMPPRRKLVAPAARLQANTGLRWIESFIDYLRSECHLAENSVMAYQRDLAKFRDWLKDRAVTSLTIRDLSDFMAALHDRKLAPASIARHIVALRMFFRYLQLEGILKENLAELLGSQKLWQRVPEVLSPGMVERFLVAPNQSDPYWRRDRALLGNCCTRPAVGRPKFPI